MGIGVAFLAILIISVVHALAVSPKTDNDKILLAKIRSELFSLK